MSEIRVQEATFGDPEVQKLVAEALAELSARYGGSGDDTPLAPTDFDPPAGRFFVAADGDVLVGCAGWRAHGPDAELKRMFTLASARGRGVARRLLAAIEDSARAAGRERVILETGSKQPEAIALYESAGYERIPNFGYYCGHDGTLSFGHKL